MTPEQQRVAIAKACGWTAREDKDRFWRAVDASGDMTDALWMSERNVWAAGIPNYLNDLNAMHDAEETLQESQRVTYSNELYDLAVEHSLKTGKWSYLSMTASQRAEAFLRTIGK